MIYILYSYIHSYNNILHIVTCKSGHEGRGPEDPGVTCKSRHEGRGPEDPGVTCKSGHEGRGPEDPGVHNEYYCGQKEGFLTKNIQNSKR